MTVTSITICSLSHRDVWRLTAPMMAKNLDVDFFRVYVPEDERAAFSDVTPEVFDIRSQSELDSNFESLLRSDLSKHGNSPRYGWYAQQFMKLEAIRKAESENVVIWDADCVPTRRIPLFSAIGAPVYMMANEGHEPYFEVIRRIFGELKRAPYSFVIPGFPFFRSWFEEMVTELELRADSPWVQELVSKSDLASRSGFSETETLGTWAYNRHPEELEWIRLNWERRGTSRFGYARNFTPDSLSEVALDHDLDIISFENWDLRGWKLFVHRVLNKLLRALGLPNLDPK